MSATHNEATLAMLQKLKWRPVSTASSSVISTGDTTTSNHHNQNNNTVQDENLAAYHRRLNIALHDKKRVLRHQITESTNHHGSAMVARERVRSTEAAWIQFQAGVARVEVLILRRKLANRDELVEKLRQQLQQQQFITADSIACMDTSREVVRTGTDTGDIGDQQKQRQEVVVEGGEDSAGMDVNTAKGVDPPFFGDTDDGIDDEDVNDQAEEELREFDAQRIRWMEQCALVKSLRKKRLSSSDSKPGSAGSEGSSSTGDLLDERLDESEESPDVTTALVVDENGIARDDIDASDDGSEESDCAGDLMNEDGIMHGGEGSSFDSGNGDHDDNLSSSIHSRDSSSRGNDSRDSSSISAEDKRRMRKVRCVGAGVGIAAKRRYARELADARRGAWGEPSGSSCSSGNREDDGQRWNTHTHRARNHISSNRRGYQSPRVEGDQEELVHHHNNPHKRNKPKRMQKTNTNTNIANVDLSIFRSPNRHNHSNDGSKEVIHGRLIGIGVSASQYEKKIIAREQRRMRQQQRKGNPYEPRTKTAMVSAHRGPNSTDSPRTSRAKNCSANRSSSSMRTLLS